MPPCPPACACPRCKCPRGKRLAEGTFAVVYADRGDATLAHKIYNRRANSFSSEHIGNEMRALALTHPNIVKIGRVEGCAGCGNMHLVMPRARTNLWQPMEGSGGTIIIVPVEQALRIVQQLLRALVAVHAHGIAHCDVHPGNVLFFGDGFDDARLCDFGKAEPLETGAAGGRRSSQGLEAPGAGEGHDRLTDQRSDMLGSWGYMPIEVLARATGVPCREMQWPLTARIDVWSVGCILALLLTGTEPFSAYEARRPVDVEDAVFARRKDVHAVHPLLTHMLAYNPADRPSAVGALALVDAELAAPGSVAVHQVAPRLVRRASSLMTADPAPGAKRLCLSPEVASGETSDGLAVTVPMGDAAATPIVY